LSLLGFATKDGLSKVGNATFQTDVRLGIRPYFYFLYLAETDLIRSLFFLLLFFLFVFCFFTRYSLDQNLNP